MEITVLLFGNLAQIAGTSKVMFQNIQDSEACNTELVAQFPAIKNSKYVLALNQTLIKENQTLKDGDEVAFLPAFSGG